LVGDGLRDALDPQLGKRMTLVYIGTYTSPGRSKGIYATV